MDGCMCVCMYVHTNEYMCRHTGMHTYIHKCTCMHICMHICMYVHRKHLKKLQNTKQNRHCKERNKYKHNKKAKKQKNETNKFIFCPHHRMEKIKKKN